MKISISISLLSVVCLLPLISLMWNIELVGIKLNWVLYPVIIVSTILYVCHKGKITTYLFFFLILCSFWFFYFVYFNSKLEPLFRVFLAFIPFFFLKRIRASINYGFFKKWIHIYNIIILVPITIALLQIKGSIPYYDFDYVGGQRLGRISGGYNKPNNLIVFFFPTFIYGLYIIKVEKKRLLGSFIILVILALVYMSGLRTSFAIYTIALSTAFFSHLTVRILRSYYKYGLNIIIGLMFFSLIYLIGSEYGFVNGVRGRLPMWIAHIFQYVDGISLIQLFGASKVELTSSWLKYYPLHSMFEAHNNYLRILITFGLMGYFLYEIIMRRIALDVLNSPSTSFVKFLQSLSFLFLIFYSFTNEPIFFPSIIWTIFIWCFFEPEKVSVNHR